MTMCAMFMPAPAIHGKFVLANLFEKSTMADCPEEQ